MPRFNPSTGEAVMGNGGTKPSVDGTYKGPAGSTSPALWYDSDTIIHQVSGVLSKTNIRTDVTTTVGSVGVNELSAARGKYLGWNAVNGLFGAVNLLAGGINRSTTDGRGMIGADGSISYVPVRATVSKTIVKHPTKVLEVELPDAYGLHILKWGQAVWNDVTTAGVLGFWGTSCAYIPGAQGGKIAKVGSDLWIVYWLEGTGLIAHKAIEPTVYHLITAGLAYHHDAISYAGKLAVCYSIGAGEFPAELIKVMDVVATSPTTAMPLNTVAGGDIVGPVIPTDEPGVSTKFDVFPQFADLKAILAQTKKTENPLYQAVQQIIERLDQFKGASVNGLNQLAENDKTGSKNVNGRFAAPTYHTKNNEKAILPNSVQLLAGPGIKFDDTVANKRTISTTAGGNHYDCPLSDGDPIEANLIYASGACIIVQIPVL